MRSIISVIHTLYIAITQSFTLHLLSFSVSFVSSLRVPHQQLVPLPSFSFSFPAVPLLAPLLIPSSFLSFSSFLSILVLAPLLVHHLLPSFVVSFVFCLQIPVPETLQDSLPFVS